jgi:hypothetical protein
LLIPPSPPPLQPFLSDLCLILKDSNSRGEEEVCVEVLGILGNLLLPDVDFHRVVTELDLLPFITSKLRVSDRIESLWGFMSK